VGIAENQIWYIAPVFVGDAHHFTVSINCRLAHPVEQIDNLFYANRTILPQNRWAKFVPLTKSVVSPDYLL